MKTTRAKIVRLLMDYFGTDDRRIEHALKVLFHAEQIYKAAPEGDEDILIAVALLHDIGIKVSEQELGYNTGKTQEQYGPPIAGRLLASIAFPPEKLEIVKHIIGNHHSPSRYAYPELKILKEADRIVNEQETIASLMDG
ncbi:MAG: HD domain-containing protein [bacterium]